MSFATSIISLLLIIGMIALIIITFVSIFNKERYNLNSKAINLQRFIKYHPEISNSSYELDRECQSKVKKCETVTLRQMLKLLFENENFSFMVNDDNSIENCIDNFEVSLVFMLFPIQKH